MPDYEAVYREQPGYFGDEPAPLLERHLHLLPRGARVLDIGVGQGRNSIPLTEKGLAVTGIDASQAAIEVTRETARRKNLAIDLWHGSFLDFVPRTPFDAVLAFGIVQELEPNTVRALCARIDEWTVTGGLVMLVAWHTDDPRFPVLEKECEHIGPNSFRLSSGEVRTYLAKQEVLGLFPGWSVIHHWEGLGPEHHHGDRVMERHGWVELIARKPSARSLERI